MDEEFDPLDLLLLAATEELQDSTNNQIKPKSLKETNLFEQESNIKPFATTTNNSLVHTGDTDSSDDEDRRNWEEKKYTESGREIKKILDVPTKIGSNKSRISRVSNWKKTSVPAVKENNKKSLNPLNNQNSSIFSQADVIFGIRVINPLVSSAVIAERMIGREAIPFNRLGRFLQIKTEDKDWVIAGVVVHKSAAKTSQKGNQFSVWTLTDLRDDIKTVAVFLFGGAHGQLWKTSVGTVVGLLNPNVLEKKEGRDEASLSIDNAQKVMVLGQSKDFGICKSVKKNGDKCTAIVNLAMCQYCVYHIKQEYQKCSIRSDLQSSFTGKGLTALRNKVLGKNEVFYAGKSYMAIPAKKSRKLEQKDNARLDSLSGKGIHQLSAKAAPPVKKKLSAARLEVPHGQRLKDLKLLEKLSGTKDLSEKTEFEGKQSSGVTIGDAKSLASSVLSRLKAKYKISEDSKLDNGARESIQNSEKLVETTPKKIKGQLPIDKFREVEDNLTKIMVSPTTNNVPAKEFNNLTRKTLFENDLTKKHPNLENPFSGVPKLTGFASGSIDLSKPIIPRRSDKAKLKAIRLIQQKGPIKKIDPNNIRGTGIKRSIDIEGGDKLDLAPKKLKVDENNTFTSERFKKIMAASSSHLDLLESRDEEEKDKYFNKLEAKERMEEKMINTHKVACKAVKCVQCKYISFSASDLCKSERHTFKVFDAVKRFFKCGHCKNRTVCLEVIPMTACSNCGGSNWQKTGMMHEKLATAVHSLSIRGGEQKFTNSVATDANLDLLVCKKFNDVGSKFLTRGFFQLEKRHACIYKKVKSLLPRRESERRAHPLSRHSDILQAVETRISMLNMTYHKFIGNNLLCFIPGKVLDEMKNVLDLVESDQTPPRTLQLLQELRDLSSMAMEHFDEHILPRVKEQVDRKTALSYGCPASSSKTPRLIYAHNSLSNEIHKVKKQSKTHKYHISFLTLSTQKLFQKLRKQNIRIKAQSLKIREQEKKIQEQQTKIQEQEATLADFKKHIDEWNQKYKDLTTEFVRAIETFVPATSPRSLPVSSPAPATPRLYKTNIKPRKTHILPKSYSGLNFDLERKRKSNLLHDLPLKRNKAGDEGSESGNLRIVELPSFSGDNEKADRATSEKAPSKVVYGSKSVFSNTDFGQIIENWVINPLNNIKSRKRKMHEDIDLK